MKNLVKPSVILSLIFMSLISKPLFSQNQKVANLADKSKIIISNDQINQYMDAFEVGESIQITEMIISEFGDQNYLLSKDEESGWIYILKLKSKRNKLFLNYNITLNACQSDNLSIEIFNFENGEIEGCNKCNHKITRK